MHILAPLVLVLGGSFLLYGQVDLWSKEMYDLEMKRIPTLVAKDVVDLRGGVKKKQISEQHAVNLFEGKYGPGAHEKLKTMVSGD